MENEKDNKNKLTQAEIAKFKALLLAKRNEILGDWVSMETEALRQERSDLSSMPIHMADLGTDNYDQEFTLELMDSERKILAEIDEALDRIEESTYGICQGTGQPISKQRLQAIPWARYRREYVELLENGFADAVGHSDDMYFEDDSDRQSDEQQDD